MILDEILDETRRTVSYSRYRLPLGELEPLAAAAAPALDFVGALRGKSGIRCIAEFKRRSPSKGWIRQEAEVAQVTASYERVGAAAISVLTDRPFFGGTLEDVRAVRKSVTIPILRKDFIIDPYQVVEARAAGADAVLLIVAALRQEDLVDLLGEVDRWGMQALVETHDRGEVERALDAGARVIGINHRDLRNFEMKMGLAASLRPLIPSDRVAVAESGIRTAEDVQSMQAAGLDAILVGEALMRSPDPGQALRALLAKP